MQKVLQSKSGINISLLVSVGPEGDYDEVREEDLRGSNGTCEERLESQTLVHAHGN